MLVAAGRSRRARPRPGARRAARPAADRPAPGDAEQRGAHSAARGEGPCPGGDPGRRRGRHHHRRGGGPDPTLRGRDPRRVRHPGANSVSPAPRTSPARSTPTTARSSALDSQVKEFEAHDAVRRDRPHGTTMASDDAPVVQVVQMILTQALRDRASDIHIEPQERAGPRPLPHRRRAARRARRCPVDGPGAGQPDQDHGRHEHRRAAPAAGRPDQHGDRGPRASTSGSPPSPSSAARRSSCGCWTRAGRCSELADLGMPDGHRRAVPARCCARRTAWSICAGPTGQRQDHDAVRVAGRDQQPRAQHHDHRGPGRVHLPVDQPDPDQRAGRASPSPAVCRSILRQDPDVILVGEIRDVETARIAVQSALTGHFVLSSVHATDTVVGAAPAARHGHRDRSWSPRRSRRWSRSGWCAASATTAASRTSPTAEELAFLRVDRRPSLRPTASAAAPAATSARTPATWSGSACTRCCRHREHPGTDPRPALRTTRSARSPAPRACAPCRRRPPGWSRPGSPPWPRSCAPST